MYIYIHIHIHIYIRSHFGSRHFGSSCPSSSCESSVLVSACCVPFCRSSSHTLLQTLLQYFGPLENYCHFAGRPATTTLLGAAACALVDRPFCHSKAYRDSAKISTASSTQRYQTCRCTAHKHPRVLQGIAILATSQILIIHPCRFRRRQGGQRCQGVVLTRSTSRTRSIRSGIKTLTILLDAILHQGTPMQSVAALQ